MDTNEDSKTPSMIPGMGEGPPGPASGLPAGPEAASEPTVESKIELASIDSPSLAPATADMTADMAADVAGPDARAGQPGKRPQARPEAAEAFEEIKPGRPKDPGPVAQEIMLVAAPASGRVHRGKFILLAAALVLAAALGAMAGVLGATGVARLAGEPATVPEPTGLQTSVAQLRSEIAALKASVDASGRNAGTQYSKLVERFDRVERMQSVATKSDAALPKDVTGSITPPAAGAAAPLPAAPTPTATTVPGWAVRDVYRGVAMLQSRMGGMVEVEPGDVLPGLGRIESIRRQDGHWVVMTSKGTITSLR